MMRFTFAGMAALVVLLASLSGCDSSKPKPDAGSVKVVKRVARSRVKTATAAVRMPTTGLPRPRPEKTLKRRDAGGE